MTTDLIIRLENEAATNRLTNKWGEGIAKEGRFEVRVIGCGSPSTGHSSYNHHVRRDYYLDGKRVSRKVLLGEM